MLWVFAKLVGRPLGRVPGGASKLWHTGVPMQVLEDDKVPEGTRDPQLVVDVPAEVPPPSPQGLFTGV